MYNEISEFITATDPTRPAKSWTKTLLISCGADVPNKRNTTCAVERSPKPGVEPKGAFAFALSDAEFPTIVICKSAFYDQDNLEQTERSIPRDKNAFRDTHPNNLLVGASILLHEMSHLKGVVTENSQSCLEPLI